MLRAFVVTEDEAAVVWRTLPANRLPYRVDRDLLGDAPGHRPAHDLAGEGVYRGCETEPPFALCFVKFLSTNSASWFRRNLQSCRPPPERRALDSELPRKVDGPHLAAEDHPRRRYLELLIVSLPLLGHIEHLSPNLVSKKSHPLQFVRIPVPRSRSQMLEPGLSGFNSLPNYSASFPSIAASILPKRCSRSE